MAGSKSYFFKDIILSLIFALIFSVILVLLHALLVKIFSLSETASRIINVVIKTVSILLGCMFGIKEKSLGVVKGLLIGLFYTALSFLIFSLLSEGVRLENIDVFDIVFGVVAGLISGIIAVNKKAPDRA